MANLKSTKLFRHLIETPTYNCWTGMLQRCNNPNNPAYPRYGGRGIKVCDRWRLFDNFVTDMGEKPNGFTLDRYPNNNGNYEPGNCRWATPKEQADNRRITKFMWNGQLLTISKIANAEGVPAASLKRAVKLYAKDIHAAVAHVHSRRVSQHCPSCGAKLNIRFGVPVLDG